MLSFGLFICIICSRSSKKNLFAQYLFGRHVCVAVKTYSKRFAFTAVKNNADGLTMLPLLQGLCALSTCHEPLGNEDIVKNYHPTSVNCSGLG